MASVVCLRRGWGFAVVPSLIGQTAAAIANDVFRADDLRPPERAGKIDPAL
ncbi:hypothetical protein [Bauldia sp.]|uniref:hypothetical protein n=1 Tax=Bauldia sp. TaxID=2575872 RepID=UPI003BAD5217